MRSAALAAPLLVAGVSALPEIAITKRPASHRFAKRQGTDSTNIFDALAYSSGGAYYANVTVGTPPQPQVVILDTGSSDLYFDATEAQTCQAGMCRGGTFDLQKSSTYNEVVHSPAFDTQFGDGSAAQGPFGSDTIGIGDVSIDHVQFGVAAEVTSTTGDAIGLMGIGYSLNEGTRGHQYPNIPEVLKDAGVIASRLYSVFLNTLADISGTILFGGIDTSKYTGDLVTVDLLPDRDAGVVFQFVTTVTGIKARINGKDSTLLKGGVDGAAAFHDSNTLPVLLDTGSAAWTLDPSDYKNIIEPAFGNLVDGDGTLSCNHQNDNTYLTIEFAGKISINVPASEFIVPYYDPKNNNEAVPYQGPGGGQTCIFMINYGKKTGQGFQTMGDSILRSMYVVYDLDNGQMALAQANTDGSAKSNVVKVPAGPNGIQSAVSGVKTAPANTAISIAAGVQATASFKASSLATPIGTATGQNALPTDAYVSVIAASTTHNAPSVAGQSGSPSSSKDAASGLTVPSMSLGPIYVTGVAIFMAALGAFAL